MTIPKYAGLSRLAEAASPIEYYPVKRRGQKRRLLPNWDAINWLERETEGDTEISDVQVLGTSEEWAEMNGVRALGWYGAKRRNMYPRRMFDIFRLEASSTGLVTYTPCEACDDFSRTWACTEHPEIAWDTRRRVWVRPGTPIWYELHPEDRPAEPEPQPTDYFDTGARPPGGSGLYDRMIEMFGQPLPSPGFTVRQADAEAYQRQAALYFQAGSSDPNQGRPGYHYDFATDRWVPDTSDDFRARGEVGAGFFRRGVEVSLPEVSADERLAAEWERQNGISLADAVRAMGDGVNPFDLGPTRRTYIDRLLGDLPDASITLTGTFTLEITSDTTEASARSVRIEVERDGDTTP